MFVAAGKGGMQRVALTGPRRGHPLPAAGLDEVLDGRAAAPGYLCQPTRATSHLQDEAAGGGVHLEDSHAVAVAATSARREEGDSQSVPPP